MRRGLLKRASIGALAAMTGLLLASAESHGLAQGKTDPNLMTISRSGQVLRQTTTTAIFWGSEWSNSTFAGDVVSGLDSFFRGFGGSEFAGLATEYYDRSGAITSASSFLGHVIDSTAPPAGTLSASTVINEACSISGNNPDPNGVYFVYTSTPGNLECALRTWGTCGKQKKPIQVVYVPQINGVDPPCNNTSIDDGSVTGHSPRLAIYGNVTGNQIMNAITDPRGTGWKDTQGDTMSFKCDGIFPPAGQYFLFSNGSMWRIRAKWSNAAYLAGTGLPNLDGLTGCVY
jgi:hypothetical protein